jgi:outer membrane PBP1 activator LpoA protein
VAQKDYAAAKKLLGELDVSALDQNQQARFWQAGITAEQGRPSPDAAARPIAQQPLLAVPKSRKILMRPGKRSPR